jgi:hypothetical protein
VQRTICRARASGGVPTQTWRWSHPLLSAPSSFAAGPHRWGFPPFFLVVMSRLLFASASAHTRELHRGFWPTKRAQVLHHAHIMPSHAYGRVLRPPLTCTFMKPSKTPCLVRIFPRLATPQQRPYQRIFCQKQLLRLVLPMPQRRRCNCGSTEGGSPQDCGWPWPCGLRTSARLPVTLKGPWVPFKYLGYRAIRCITLLPCLPDQLIFRLM